MTSASAGKGKVSKMSTYVFTVEVIAAINLHQTKVPASSPDLMADW